MRKRKYVSLCEGTCHVYSRDQVEVQNNHNNHEENENDERELYKTKYELPLQEDSLVETFQSLEKKEDSSLHYGIDPSKKKRSTQKKDVQWPPIPQCHNIVSTSQILSSQTNINLQRLADLFPFTTYDRKRFAAIAIRLASPRCTCLLFGSGKLVITGSTSYSACVLASHEITRLLRNASPRDWFEVNSCIIQNIVAHVELPSNASLQLDKLYAAFCECSTYQRSIFPGLVLRPPDSPIVLLIFTSGRIVCTGGKSYDDIYFGFNAMLDTLKKYISFRGSSQ